MNITKTLSTALAAVFLAGGLSGCGTMMSKLSDKIESSIDYIDDRGIVSLTDNLSADVTTKIRSAIAPHAPGYDPDVLVAGVKDAVGTALISGDNKPHVAVAPGEPITVTAAVTNTITGKDGTVLGKAVTYSLSQEVGGKTLAKLEGNTLNLAFDNSGKVWEQSGKLLGNFAPGKLVAKTDADKQVADATAKAEAASKAKAAAKPKKKADAQPQTK